MRVGLLTPQSPDNLGDTATLATAITLLQKRVPGVEPVLIVSETRRTSTAFGLPSFPVYGVGAEVRGENLRSVERSPTSKLGASARIFRFARSLDAVIVVGGGQFDDYWGGAWAHPYALACWALSTRLRRSTVHFASVGLDRLSSRASREISLAALRSANTISFRDTRTATYFESLGVRDGALVPDIVFAMGARLRAIGGPTRGAFAVVNPASKAMWSHGDDPEYGRYIQSFAGLCQWFSAQGLHVKLVSTQSRMDSGALDDVARKLEAGSYSIHRPDTVDSYIAELSGALVAVTSRFHGIVFPMTLGVPVVTVATMGKMRELMSESGFESYAIPYPLQSSQDLVSTAERAIANRDEIRAKSECVSEWFSRRVEAEFDRIVQLFRAR